ncbi:MAG TPA: alkaline phosphatase family protein [Thermoanaerobaculia bacterium]|nr:alkaline phosphatase family protein [Thermoanaerobaculia bacterium]
MRPSPLRAVCLGGFLYGSIVYGLVLSLIHVLHNRLGSTRDALVTWLIFALLYGLGAVATFLLGYVLARLRRKDPIEHGVWIGLLVFNLGFWELFWLYGLTYDQYPFGRLSGAGGMVAFVAVLVALIGLAVAVASWLLFRLLLGIWRRGWLPRIAVAAFLLGLVIHAAAPLWAGRPWNMQAAANPPPEIPVEETGLKVALVGLDGADWQVLRPMIDRGELPAFAGMMKGGSTASLATFPDSNSAVIWTSLYTGALPDRHGVLDFYRIELPGMGSEGLFPVHRTFFKELAGILSKPGMARQKMINRYSVHALPIWEVADHAGMTIGIVDGYFYSFPAIVPSKPESWVLSYGLDGYAQAPGGKNKEAVELFAQPSSLFRELRPLLSLPDFEWQSAVTLRLLSERPQPKLLNVYTHEPDTVQHLFWKWYQPQYFLGVDEEEAREKGDRIPALHRGFDAFLGKLQGELEPNTVLIVASDHGHAPTILHQDFYTQHRHGPPGILLMRGGPVKPGYVIKSAHILDLYPTMLYLLGLPVPEDAAGKVLLDALNPEFVRQHPVRTIPTYETLGPAKGLPQGRRESGMNDEELKKLEALGYL